MYALTDYINSAMKKADYEKLENNTHFGRIPNCSGIVAFWNTLVECAEQLRSVLEEWVILGIRLGHNLPVINGIDLNEVKYDSPVPMQKV